MPGEPDFFREGATRRLAWVCWWESCPFCLSMEGLVFTWDQWLAAGIMPGIHAHCDCTLREVGEDVPLSDPAIFGFPLDTIFDLEGRWHFRDQNDKRFATNFLDVILANTPPGGTIKDAFARIKTLDSGKAGFTSPGEGRYPTVMDWFIRAWSRYFDWGGTWRTYRTGLHYQHLNGMGSRESMDPRPEPLRSYYPVFTHNRYHRQLFGE
jgi:hypothetical protein